MKQAEADASAPLPARFLVATVIASAVIPSLVANFAFLPRHLLPEPAPDLPPGAVPVPAMNRRDTLADE